MSDNIISLNIKVDAEAFNNSMAKFLDCITNHEWLTERIGHDVVKFSQDRIARGKQTAPDGTPWVPLAKSTVRRKKAKGFGDKKMLVQTESLYQNIVLGNVSKESFEVGSDMAYARIHQFGGKAGRGLKATIPARPYIGISEDELQKLEGRVAGWLKAKLAAAK